MKESFEELKLKVELFKTLFNGYAIDTAQRTEEVFEILKGEK